MKQKQKTEVVFFYKNKARKIHLNISDDRLKEIHNTNKLTKDDIELLAKDIKQWARENRKAVGYDTSLLYNGKHDYIDYQIYTYSKGTYKSKHVRKIDKNQDPHKWCKWFPKEFILGLTVDGNMYCMLNYGDHDLAFEKLKQLLRCYNLYLECAEPCYWYACPIRDMDVEYTY